MRKAEVCMHGKVAGVLEVIEEDKSYRFSYLQNYEGPSISLTMPVEKKEFIFDQFPPFFDGLLPEGILLDGLLKQFTRMHQTAIECPLADLLGFAD